MRLNNGFGKLSDNNIQYAPCVLRIVEHHHEEIVDPDTGETQTVDYDTYHTELWPTADDYKHMGWLPVKTSAPTDVPDGWHYERDGNKFEQTDDAIVAVYKLVENPPPPPRTFSKMKIVAALTTAGVWETVKEWIQNNKLYDLYLAAQVFSEDDSHFVVGKSAVQELLGWKDQQVEDVLAASIAGGF